MSKKTTIILITIIALIFISGGVYLWQSQEKESSLESMDYIQIKDTPEGKIVENTKEGISMKVPDGWEVNQFINDNKDLELRKFGSGQYTETGEFIESGLVDGIILDVYIADNPKKLKIEELVNGCPVMVTKEGGKEIKKSEIECKLSYETVDDIKVSKRISKVTGEGEDESGNPIFVDNAKRVEISFTKDKKIYTFSCKVVGENYENYSQECEEIIKDKIKNEF